MSAEQKSQRQSTLPSPTESFPARPSRHPNFVSASLFPTTYPIFLRTIMKRKNDETHAANGKAKKRAPSEDDAKQSFRTDLFATKILEKYKSDYAVSEPYVLRLCHIPFYSLTLNLDTNME